MIDDVNFWCSRDDGMDGIAKASYRQNKKVSFCLSVLSEIICLAFKVEVCDHGLISCQAEIFP